MNSMNKNIDTFIEKWINLRGVNNWEVIEEREYLSACRFPQDFE
jgi:hypothetical protein